MWPLRRGVAICMYRMPSWEYGPGQRWWNTKAQAVQVAVRRVLGTACQSESETHYARVRGRNVMRLAHRRNVPSSEGGHDASPRLSLRPSLHAHPLPPVGARIGVLALLLTPSQARPW